MKPLRFVLAIVIALLVAAPAAAQKLVRPDVVLDSALEQAAELPPCVHAAAIAGDTLLVTGGLCDAAAIGTIRRAPSRLECTHDGVDHETYLASSEAVRVTVCGPGDAVFQVRIWLLTQPPAIPGQVTAARLPMAAAARS